MLLFGLHQCFSNSRQQPPWELPKHPGESSSRTGKRKAGCNYCLEVFVLGREQLNAFNCWTQLSVHKHLQPVITEPSDFPPPEKLSCCQFNSCIKTVEANKGGCAFTKFEKHWFTGMHDYFGSQKATNFSLARTCAPLFFSLKNLQLSVSCCSSLL